MEAYGQTKEVRIVARADASFQIQTIDYGNGTRSTTCSKVGGWAGPPQDGFCFGGRARPSHRDDYPYFLGTHSYGGIATARFTTDPDSLPLSFMDVNLEGGRCEPVLMAPIASALFDKTVGSTVPAGAFDVPANCSVDAAPDAEAPKLPRNGGAWSPYAALV
jgi:hypothetical protein